MIIRICLQLEFTGDPNMVHKFYSRHLYLQLETEFRSCLKITNENSCHALGKDCLSHQPYFGLVVHAKNSLC